MSDSLFDAAVEFGSNPAVKNLPPSKQAYLFDKLVRHYLDPQKNPAPDLPPSERKP